MTAMLTIRNLSVSYGELTILNNVSFDLTPGEYEIRESSADYTGRLCVIGSALDEAGLSELFGI